MGRVIDWLDERIALRHLIHLALDEPIPGGPRVAYVFGSALLGVFLLQIFSGAALLLYYVPSADHAHTSVAYIMKVVTSGSFIRGLHVYGASAMVILLVLHFSQAFLYGSYKGRRELQWLSGCLLLALVLGMGFTGYLLPWDEKSYFATLVGTNVSSEIPFIGTSIKRLMLGGSTLGTLTLSRFFLLHVLILPGLIVLLIASHLFFLRKRGPAGPVTENPYQPKLPTQPFYPGQVMRDWFATLLVIIAIGLLAHLVPPDLGPRANPTDTQFLPRPDWYFRFLFQWLKYWRGAYVAVGLGLIPAVISVLFVGLPFLDRKAERRPWRRSVSIGMFTIVLAGVVTLTVLSYRDDDRDTVVAAELARQDLEARYFMQAPFRPDSAATPAPSARLIAQGATLFEAHGCNFCHGEGGVGGVSSAPRLVGISQLYSPEQLMYLLRHPTPKMEKVGMIKSLNFKNDEEMWAIIAYIESLRQPVVSGKTGGGA